MTEQINKSDVNVENKMGTMPVPKLLFNMAIPMVVSMLIQALYNIVDSAFVGRYSSEALEAVSIAFPIQNLMIAVSTGTGVGINALLSRHLGEKKFDEANKTANTGIFLAICSYIAFAVIGLTVMYPYYSMQSDIHEVIVYGEEYLSIVTVCGFGLFGEIVAERLLQSTGKTFYSMLTQGTGAIINIILDPILIFGMFGLPEMGVAGAAIATVIGQCVAAVLGFILNIKVNKEIRIDIKSIFKPERKEIGKIYAVGIPSILMASITSVLTVGMNLILKKFSEDAITVFGIYFKLNSFVFMPIFGMNNGLVPILSYNYGAVKYDRIKKAVKLAMACAIAYMIVGLIVFQIMPDKLLMIFSVNSSVMSIGVAALKIISLSFLFAGVGIIGSTVFQAIGNPVHSLIMSVLRQLVIILPAAFLLSFLGNVDYVWWSYPIAEVVSFVLCLILLVKTLKKID
ncbi:MAG: MATE family efflux transporter [Lachnospira sp.]